VEVVYIATVHTVMKTSPHGLGGFSLVSQQLLNFIALHNVPRRDSSSNALSIFGEKKTKQNKREKFKRSKFLFSFFFQLLLYLLPE